MGRKKLPIILFVWLLVGCTSHVYAKDYNYNEFYGKPQSIEKQYQIMGYQAISIAVKEFEMLYQRKVSLPTNKPPIDITHTFGIIDSYSYPPKLEIEYVNEDRPKEQIKLFVIPAAQGIFKKAPIARSFSLKGGEKAIQLRDRYHNILIFHKNDWEYILASSKRIQEKVSLQDLVDMANSIE